MVAASRIGWLALSLVAAWLASGLQAAAAAEPPLAPARARPSVEPAPPVAPGVPGAPSAPADKTLDVPSFSALVVPLPFVAIAGVVSYQNFAIGPTRHEVHLLGGYSWSYGNTLYDPRVSAPTPIAQPQQGDTYGFNADWGWRITPLWTLALAGYVAGGNVSNAPGYDADLTLGLSGAIGPRLTYADLDSRDWPTRGFLARGSYAGGYHWGTASAGLQRGSLEFSRFVPMGPDATIALHMIGRLGTPHLPWIDKFEAGYGQYLRGYHGNRFAGNEQLTGTLEYRNLFLPRAIPWSLLENAGVVVGLGFEAFIDAGRVWESSLGVPFPADPRLGAGTGLILTINRAPLGRLELNVSNEGIVPVTAFATSF